MNTQSGISGWLVRHAAASAPLSLRERLEEEWLADLQARRGNVSKLMFGVGCCWAAQTIAREFSVGAIGAGATGGSATIVAYGSHAPQRWSRRPGAMSVIIALHVIVIYAFAMVFNHPPRPTEPPIINGDVLPIKPTAHPPPPGPKVEFSTTQVDLPPPERLFSFPSDPKSAVQTVSTEPTGSGAITEIIRAVGGPGAGFPDAEEYYPAPAKWLGEQGSAAVRVCVDTSGRLTSTPTVSTSSGSARLDAGAIRLAQAGSGHYRPTKENGRPVSSCYAFRVTFRLQ